MKQRESDKPIIGILLLWSVAEYEEQFNLQNNRIGILTVQTAILGHYLSLSLSRWLISWICCLKVVLIKRENAYDVQSEPVFQGLFALCPIPSPRHPTAAGVNPFTSVILRAPHWPNQTFLHLLAFQIFNLVHQVLPSAGQHLPDITATYI